jgi:hypothetical protein
MASILFMNLIVSINLFTALLSLLLVQCSSELFSKSFLSIVTDVYATGEFIKYNSINNLVNDMISIAGNLAVAALLTFVSQKIILSFSIGFVFLILFLIWKNFPNAANRPARADQTKSRNQHQQSFKTVFFNRKYVSFIVLLFILNLDYGYIPDVFPYYITKYTHIVSPLLIGFIQSGVNIGQLFSTILILKIGHRVSDITRLGLIGSAGVFVIFPFFIGSPMMIVILFALYGYFDSITQPFFSYFVSNIESRIKGRVLGIIDSIVLLSAPIGMYVGTKISGFGIGWVCFYLVMVFGFAIAGISLSSDYSKVVVEKNVSKQKCF